VTDGEEGLPLPWQEDAWRRLQAARRRDRLPHALLFHGPAGTGKNRFARLLARSLLCEQADEAGLPCGACRACTLQDAGNHPDLREVMPLEDKQHIGVDQVRAIAEYLALKPQYGEVQCVLITPAECLNENAANSLLKTLEEPTPGACLILVTARPALLAATIRSRCQKFAFPVPPVDQALPWLEARLRSGEDSRRLLNLAEGAPFAALALAESGGVSWRLEMLAHLEQLMERKADAPAVAEKWLKSGAKESLYGLYTWITALIRLRMGGGGSPGDADPEVARRLGSLARRMEVRTLFQRLDEAREALRLVERQINAQLLLEDVLIAWQQSVE